MAKLGDINQTYLTMLRARERELRPTVEEYALVRSAISRIEGEAAEREVVCEVGLFRDVRVRRL